MALPRRVLVTGGAGFIGSHLCERLIAEGHTVVCLDNYSTGRRENIAALLDHPRFTAMDRDIASPLDIEADHIYNLACPASPRHYQAAPLETLKTNIHGALTVLDLALRLNAKVFQASTSEIYGDPTQHPQDENYWGHVNPIGPRACYNEGKRCAETLFFDYRRQHGIEVRVARLFNTYGPRMRPDDGRVVSNFIVQALRGEDITLHGDGTQTRSFCYVSDMIEGIVRFMEADDATAGPLNLGNPAEISIRQLAETILRLTGSRSRIVQGSRPTDDPKRRRPDITRATTAFGWHPATGLEDGLKDTIAWFRSVL